MKKLFEFDKEEIIYIFFVSDTQNNIIFMRKTVYVNIIIIEKEHTEKMC